MGRNWRLHGDATPSSRFSEDRDEGVAAPEERLQTRCRLAEMASQQVERVALNALCGVAEQLDGADHVVTNGATSKASALRARRSTSECAVKTNLT